MALAVRCLATAALALAFSVIVQAVPAQAESLAGRLLVAPRDMPDSRFAGSVVFMLQHDDSGALGLIVNRALAEASNAKLHRQLGLAAPDKERWFRLFFGGPVEPSRVMVLHTLDFSAPETQTLGGAVAISGLKTVLTALAEKRGPKRFLICAGYAGWAPGQLEAELAREDWHIADGDAALILDNHVADKWRRALDRVEQKL